MTRLYEYQGKALLEGCQIPVPRGSICRSIKDVRRTADELGCEVVIKAQAWVTGRASLGAIRFAKTPDEAVGVATSLLGMQIKGFTVDAVIVEEKLAILREFFGSIIIDDQVQSPVVIFSNSGGSRIEKVSQENPDAVAQVPIDILQGLQDYQARDLVRRVGIHGQLQHDLGNFLVALYQVARKFDARTVEVNPIALTTEGKLVAVDCRITIDDNAVFRHPELGIEIAREFDHPPTALEKIAWQVEKNDYRGTFYFIQLEQEFKKGQGVIGFHGAGGGGSMMSMDVLMNCGFKLANFVDTSGNPPASKIYRAARIILSQTGIDGYFAAGSGVASQEQFHSARGLVKAFLSNPPLTVPAVIRLGGNGEDLAIEILQRASKEIHIPVEGYGRDTTLLFCAERLKVLVSENRSLINKTEGLKKDQVRDAYIFETITNGTISFDHTVCLDCVSKACIRECIPGILELESGVPVLNISQEEAKRGGCIECLACEIECYFDGARGCKIVLPIPGLED
jgi:succinyl-CoA synthetase beta subunit